MSSNCKTIISWYPNVDNFACYGL